MTAACCLNISKHSTHGCHCMSYIYIYIKNKIKKKRSCQLYALSIETNNRTLLQCDLWGCTDYCTYWPFAYLNCSQSVVFTHAKERDAVKSLLRAHIFTPKEDAISSLKRQISHYFFDNHLNIYIDLISCLTRMSP